MMGDKAEHEATILLVDDNQLQLDTLALRLEQHYEEEAQDIKVEIESDERNVLAILQEKTIDVVVSDLDMPFIRGDELNQMVQKFDDKIQFIIHSGVGGQKARNQLIDENVRDIIEKAKPGSDTFKDLVEAIRKALKVRQERLAVSIVNSAARKQRNIVHEDPKMEKVFSIVDKVAGAPSPVLVQGEPGTGKELIAHEIHRKRNEMLRLKNPSFNEKDYPYLAVNCGALSRTLLESQLFGHKKGAFTGSVADQDGVFVAARKGTLFLDEITELDLDLQVKLLRALQEKEVTPLGSTQALPVHARVVTATNAPIKQLVEERKFRDDLYYRINVVNIEIPPLRERKRDVEALASHFLLEMADAYNCPPRSLSPGALELLKKYRWPGNVRELHNVIERSFALGDEYDIIPRDLPDEIQGIGTGHDDAGDARRDTDHEAGLSRFREAAREVGDSIAAGQHLAAQHGSFPTYDEVVAEHIRRALLHTQGVKSRAASLLSIDRNRLYRLMSKYRIPADGVSAD